MCDAGAFDTLIAASRACESLLAEFDVVTVTKAFDLDDPADLDQAIIEFASLLRQGAHASNTAAVRAAVKVLDVDWHQTSAARRRELVAESLKAAARHTDAIPDKLAETFRVGAEDVVTGAKKSARRHGISVGSDFNTIDKRIVQHLRRSEANFVSDEYGRRKATFSRTARRVVARGVEDGLSRADIARDLRAAAETTIGGKGGLYWEVASASFIGRGRSFASLSSYAEAGVERYVLEAVLDEQTTETCRFLHGKTFSVDGSLETFAKVDESPDDIRAITPWVRSGVGADGKPVLYVPQAEGRARIATIDQPGAGQRDKSGAYSGALSNDRLQELGISFPPFHALCRTVTLPDSSAYAVTPRVASAVPKPQRARAGPLELLAQSKTFASSSGQALPLDGGVVENFNVQFRQERIGDRDVTKVRFKLTDQHADRVRKALLETKGANPNDIYRHASGTLDPKTRRVNKRGAQGELKFDAVSARVGATNIKMVTQKGALTNLVEMDIESADPRKAFREYSEVAKKLAIPDAASFPSGDAVDTLKKARLITHYDRQGWDKLRALKELNPETIRPIYEEAKSRVPELGSVFQDAKLTRTVPGHVALHSRSQANALKKRGVKRLFHDLSDSDALIPILSDPEGSGLLSSAQRYHRGLFVDGMSTSTDFGTGGADGVFTRIVANKRPVVTGRFDARVLINSDQMGRSDWFMFNNDNFGRAGPNDFHKRTLVPELSKLLDGELRSSNEVIFQHGIPTSAMEGVVLPDRATRERIIKRLTEAGVSEVNGKPLSEFILEKDPD